MRLPLLPLLALLVLGASGEEDEEEETYSSDEDGYGGDEASKGDEEEALPQAVYVMEHGFLAGNAPKWTPRGTLLLTGALGRGFEARLSDAKEFVEMRPDLQPAMTDAAGKEHYYAVRMYSPEKPKRVLQASIPAKLLADHFEDWHDILEVTVGSTGAPVSLSYRVRHTLGLALFDHTQVHISEPSRSTGPRVDPSSRPEGSSGGSGGAKGEQPAQSQSFLRKYWWVIIIVLLLLSHTGDDGSSAGGKASGGGGGGGGGRRSGGS